MEFDSGALSWVKDEIDRALDEALAKAAEFAATPAQVAPLRFCLNHLHQVTGALSMIGLDGARHFAEQGEHFVTALEKGQLEASEHGEMLLCALRALRQYIQSLADGAADVPMRLYPEYQAIQHACGREHVHASELFFPDLFGSAPASLESIPVDPASLPAFLNARAHDYRRHLVQWLKSPEDATLLAGMSAALQAVEQAQPRPAQKTLWWVAAGLLDALVAGSIPLDRQARQLCVQLERQIHYLAQDNARPNSRLLRELLYYVACSAPVTPRIADIQRAFELEKYAAAQDPHPTPEAAAVEAPLETLREGVTELKECWTRVSAGERAQRQAFMEHARSLLAEAESTGGELSRALADVLVCAEALVASDDAVDMMFTIEMATALLMLESALDAGGKARIQGLADAAAQAATLQALLPGASRAPAVSAAGATPGELLAVLAQVADEVRANLQRAEQTLDAFFRDETTRPELAALAPVFAQVAGALRMLEQPVAAAVVDATQALVERFGMADGQAQLEEFELVAESLSALGFYVERLLQDDPAAALVLDPLPARLQAALAAAEHAAETVSEQVDVPAGVLHAPRIDRAFEQELLEVFLDECKEVLATLASCLQALRAAPDDREALITLRRGFHTLKGSGRTVGLAAMGDTAWAIEQVLNRLIETSRVPAPAVLDYLEAATVQFQEWARQLFLQGEAEVAPGLWQARADALLQAGEPKRPAGEHVAAEPEVSATSEDDTLPLPEELLVIGGRHAVSRPLYEIFLAEARTNLALLQALLSAAMTHAEPPIADVERPAHTLGGVSRTVGLVMIAELASALESWLEQVGPRFMQLDAEELHMFDQALLALQAMLQKAENRRLPAAAGWLCAMLRGEAAHGSAVPLAVAFPEGQASADAAEEVPMAVATGAVHGIDAVPSFIAPPDVAGVDRQLLEVFLEEAAELMPLVGKQLREWQAQPAAAQPQQILLRALHTLKGSARMAGAAKLGDQLHDLESQVDKLVAKGTPAGRSFSPLFRQYDRIDDLLGELRGLFEAPRPQAESGMAEQSVAEGLAVAPMMRVQAELIDRLVNEAGEVSIARSRIERQMETFKSALFELTDSLTRLRGQLREAEIEADTQMQSRLTQLQETDAAFDPLEFDRYTRFQELTRMMAESVHDVATVQQGLVANLNEAGAALSEQARMTKQLQQGLLRTRMVRFDTVAERLHRTVRQTSTELKKPAELEIHGAGVEIDRSVLEKMTGPLEHLLRNAVSHGLEDARTRVAHDKPKMGRLKLQARQEGNEIILALGDDGRGLDFERIRERAAGMGMPVQGLGHAALIALIFEPGFTTSASLNQVSGRGVGLDAVRAEITALGGRIEIATEAGRGSTFTIYLPLTLAVSQTVLVRVGKQEFLLPAPMVEQVQKIKHGAMASIEAEGQYAWGGQHYPLQHLARLLGLAEQPEPQTHVPLLLLRSGARRLALVVDEIRGNREIVVKNIGPQLAAMGSVAGATVLGDGRVMLVLNPIHMMAREVLQASPQVPDAAAQHPTILVVDDSLTMRKVISRLLVREGYRVETAKDGIDALQQLESLVPDVVLLDIEMPRMDGFELARSIRGNVRTAALPLIVISSRTADKHRALARELGVDAYLGKPYQEDELLAQISAFMGLEGSASGRETAAA